MRNAAPTASFFIREVGTVMQPSLTTEGIFLARTAVALVESIDAETTANSMLKKVSKGGCFIVDIYRGAKL